MSYFLFLIKSAIFDFSRNKARAFLTSLGILIGVASVVLLMAFVSGLKIFITSQFQGLGSNLIFVLPGKVLPRGGLRPGGGTLGGARFDEKDLVTLKRVKEIEYAVPFFVKTLRVSANGKSEIFDLRATTQEAFAISHLEPETGIIFTKTNVEKRSKVVVIGAKVAEKLFANNQIALNKTLKIEGQSYTIIGILKQKGDVSHDFDSSLVMPYKTAYNFNPDKKFFDIHIQLRNYRDIALVKEKIKSLLLKRYKEDDFSVIEQTEILDTVNSILNALKLILVAVASISLVVGGIGIMNIMYVSVTERIKEIGIRRAVGAKGLDILWQFLIEAVILSLFGGLLGIALAFVITLIIQRVFPAYIDLNSVLLALGVSSAIGIIFGVFPAKKAAELSPIDAIRYE